MVKVSTRLTALLASLLLLGTIAYGQTQPWPLKRAIDLSSGFGDFRANRFHAGVDLRTGGADGAEVYSPVDGFVWRVKMSYRGYGKGLYIKGDDNHLYVFAHLSGFNNSIQAAVLEHQFLHERYYADIYFPKDSIRVRKGQLIAYSGQTGVGAPHLHFEKRSPDNVPLNPLTHGFALEDRTMPTFERVGFHLLDDRSLFRDGARRLFRPVRKVSEGRFTIDSLLHFSAPFGIMAHCYDQKRPGGMRQSIYRLTLTIDGIPYYNSTLDSLPFEIGPMVGLLFDPSEAADDERRVRRLYRPHLDESLRAAAGSAYGGATDGRCGYATTVSPQPGEHLVEIVGEDVAGNKSVLTFGFVWTDADSDSSLSYRCDYRDQNEEDFQIVGYDISEFGLITEIRRNDSTYHFYFPPHLLNDSYVDLQDLMLMFHQGRLLNEGICTDVVGWAGGADLFCDSQVFKVSLPAERVYGARLLGASVVEAREQKPLPYASKVYELRPEAFPVRDEFEVSIQLKPGAPLNARTGLCWFSKSDSEWVWIESVSDEDDIASGSSLGGGLFAAIVDTTAPTIKELNILAGHKYWNRKPRVKCVIEDNLSGFEDDLSIVARMDGQYILPELDIESGAFVGLLKDPLKLGPHELTLKVTDRAGNSTEQRVAFDVVRKQK